MWGLERERESPNIRETATQTSMENARISTLHQRHRVTESHEVNQSQCVAAHSKLHHPTTPDFVVRRFCSQTLFLLVRRAKQLPATCVRSVSDKSTQTNTPPTLEWCRWNNEAEQPRQRKSASNLQHLRSF